MERGCRLLEQGRESLAVVVVVVTQGEEQVVDDSYLKRHS